MTITISKYLVDSDGFDAFNAQNSDELCFVLTNKPSSIDETDPYYSPVKFVEIYFTDKEFDPYSPVRKVMGDNPRLSMSHKEARAGTPLRIDINDFSFEKDYVLENHQEAQIATLVRQGKEMYVDFLCDEVGYFHFSINGHKYPIKVMEAIEVPVPKIIYPIQYLEVDGVSNNKLISVYRPYFIAKININETLYYPLYLISFADENHNFLGWAYGEGSVSRSDKIIFESNNLPFNQLIRCYIKVEYYKDPDRNESATIWSDKEYIFKTDPGGVSFPPPVLQESMEYDIGNYEESEG